MGGTAYSEDRKLGNEAYDEISNSYLKTRGTAMEQAGLIHEKDSSLKPENSQETNMVLEDDFICHLVYEHDFIQKYNDFICEFFDWREHLFIVYANHAWDESKKYHIKNSLYINNFNSFELLRLIEKSAQILVHCLYTPELTDFLFRNQHLLQKVNWLVWGGDLYLYRQVGSCSNSEENEIKRRSIIKNIGYISTPFEEEYRLALDVYESGAQHKFAFYPPQKDFCEYRLTSNIERDGAINIFVGNSGYPTNNHHQAFSYLSKFCSDNIRVYCPLSYGDKDYIKKVCIEGKRIFENKFIPLLDFIQFDEYVNLLNRMNVIVMNHDRQQGVGNILSLLYLGKKIYMKTDITTYKNLTRAGVVLYDINDIKKIGLNDFTLFSDDIGKSNSKIIESTYSKENCVKTWERIFKDAMKYKDKTTKEPYKPFENRSSSRRKIHKDGHTIGSASSPRKILFVNHNLFPFEISGTPLSTRNHVLGISKRGLEVAALIPSNTIRRGYEKELMAEGFTLYQVPALDKIKAYLAGRNQIETSYLQLIEHIIDDFRPQIVHINDYVYMPAEIIEIFSSKGCSIVREVCNCEELCHKDYPVISHGLNGHLCSGPETPEKCYQCLVSEASACLYEEHSQKVFKVVVDQIISKFEYVRKLYQDTIDKVIFTSEPFKEYFTRFVPISEEKARIIPRGFNFGFPRNIEKTKNITGAVNFAFVGNIMFSKGIDVVLRAFETISSECNFSLHIYGHIINHEYRQWLERLQALYPLKFFYHGPFEGSDLPRIASSIDVCIVPSYFDTYNRVLREFLYLGVPVIATDFFGAYIIEENKNGFKIPIGDSNSLAQKMIDLINNPTMIENLSRGAQQTQVPELEREIDAMIEVYNDLYHQRSKREKAQLYEMVKVNEMKKPSADKTTKLIAFYLPQYHPIPENDLWWGKGFTEWMNVAKARPLFPGHYQPHIPADLGFYDLRLPEIREEQAELAKQYGIYGFCYYHYWFNGKQLLHRVFDEVLASGKPDFPFCLCWANEHWTRAWDGGEKKILMQQQYSPKDDLEHIAWLIHAFKDPRYIKVQDKPLMLIYRTSSLPAPADTASAWREQAKKAGFPDLYLCTVESFESEHGDPSLWGFDASVEFQPDWSNLGNKINDYNHLNVFDYNHIVNSMISKQQPSYKRFPCVTPSWDNSPRRGINGHIFINSNPAAYKKWLRNAISRVEENTAEERIVFLNAWNEWAEGNHLEPDLKNGRNYLKATLQAVTSDRESESFIEKLTDKATAAIEEGLLDEAEELFKAALSHDPMEPRTLHRYALLKHLQGDIDRAVPLLEKAVSLDSSDPELANDLGALYYQAGKRDQAMAFFSKALELDCNFLEAKKNIADFFREIGRLSEAAHFYNEILAQNPNDTDAVSALKIMGHDLKWSDWKSDSKHVNISLGSSAFATTKEPLASIIIPVYNQLEYTKQCLEALKNHTPEGLYEVIIVDNKSSDGTREFLINLGDTLKVIFNEINHGFTIACNQGARLARGKYLVFLNNDTIPLDGWLTAMVDVFKLGEDIAAVGSKLIYPNMILQEAGGIVFSDGNAWNFGRGDLPDQARYNRLIEVDYCSGASLMVRKDRFEEVGGFDEIYAPAYYEDTDLCFSLREKGYRVLYQPESEVIHFEGKTAGVSTNSGFKKYQVINQEKFRQKWEHRLKDQGPSPYQGAPKPFTADRKRRLAGFTHNNRINCMDRLGTSSDIETINFLIVDPFLPIYDRASGSFRLFQIVKILAHSPNVHITYIARHGQHGEKYIDLLKTMGVTVYHTDPEKLLSFDVMLFAPCINLKYILSQRRYHYAYLSFYEIAIQYLPDIRLYSPDTKVIIDTVDIHFLRETREAELYNNNDLMMKAKNTQKNEIDIYKRADALITVTEQDAEVIRPYFPGKPIYVIPNIHPVPEYEVPLENRNGIIFIGNYRHPPNIDAVKYYLKEIHPKIRERGLSIPVSIIGDGLPEEVKALGKRDKNIIFTGWVPETKPFLDSARISIAPLRYGAGMKGKVGEALAAGLPVVTTSIGAEGMGLTHGQDVMISDSADEFADMIIKLYHDDSLWKKLSRNGICFINENYSTDAVARKVRKIFQLPESSIHVEEPVQEKRERLTSIIILCLNQITYTKLCLQSIEKFTTAPYELILVDNGSTDGTQAFLEEYEKTHEGCKVILNKNNRGFASGSNQGIASAKGDYILLLNNDVIVTHGWLERLINHIEADPNIGMVGPVSNSVSGPQLVKEASYGRDLEKMQEFAHRYSCKHTGKIQDLLRLVGFCLLIKREVINIIGGLDENFISGNFEDDDLCLRSFIAGYRNIMAKDVFVHHYGSMTFKGNNIDYRAAMRDNFRYFTNKWKDIVKVDGNGYKVQLSKEQQLKKLIEWGEERFSQGDVEAAVRIFGRILVIDRANCQALNNLGVIQWQFGQIVDAIETFQTALGSNLKDADALANLLQAITETGRIDLLKPNLLDMLKQDQPANPDVARLIELAGTRCDYVDSEGQHGDWTNLAALT